MALPELTTALATLRGATEIGKAIIAAGNAVEVAQLRLQLADIMTALADARTALAEVQEKIDEKDAKIRALTDALETKARVVRDQDAYYELDVNEVPKGDGYCQRCWEGDHKLHHLTYPLFNNESSRCPHCRTEYTYFRTAPKP